MDIIIDLHHALDMFSDALIFTNHLWWQSADYIVGFVVVSAQQAAIQIVDDTTDGWIAGIGRIN